LPNTGERVPNDIMIRDKKAVVIGFIPENTACGSGGDSFVMEMNACSGGRLNNPQFDINGDGKVDENDMIALTDADGNIIYDGDGNPIMVVPTGMMFPGRLLPPAILRTGDEEIKYFTTNVGTIVTMREKAVPMGIIYWMEVIP
jgi:type IV pilus assembly protein PilY1